VGDELACASDEAAHAFSVCNLPLPSRPVPLLHRLPHGNYPALTYSSLHLPLLKIQEISIFVTSVGRGWFLHANYAVPKKIIALLMDITFTVYHREFNGREKNGGTNVYLL
jgi:hypothetical protein